MLDCRAMQRFLHPYLDGELSARDAVDIQAHLDGCPDCVALYRNEQLYLELLKASLQHPPAPARLERAVKQALAEVGQPGRSRPWLRFATATAAVVAVLALVLLGTLSLGKKTVPELVDAAVETHQLYLAKHLRLDVESHDAARVSLWLQERAGFPVSLAQEPVKHLRLLGGRLVEVQGKKAVFLAYEVEGRPLSLVMTTAQGVALFGAHEVMEQQARFYQSSYHGLQTLSWTLEGMAYVFVSDAQALNRRACLVCHTSGQMKRPITGPSRPGSSARPLPS